MYAMIMFYYHWLIKKPLWSMAGQIQVGGKTKLNAGRKKAESGRHHVAAERERHQNLTGKPQPSGDA